MTGPRILIADIETMAAKVYTWGMFNQNHSIDQIIEPDRMICFAAKWYGSPKVIFKSEYHDSPLDMALAVYELLNEADVLVTYNGNSFDIPWFQRVRHEHGLDHPSPFTSVDLYRVFKKNERHLSHKLAYITRQYNLTGKFSHHGFMLWRECNGDFGPEAQRKAWIEMRKYNKQDVVTTDELFEEALPYITTIPHVSLWSEFGDDGRPTCPSPVCGSVVVTRQGWRRTKTRRYPRYQCSECGRWFSGNRSDMGVTAV